jgi:5-methylcytosine-specific restriction protein B
MSLELLVEIVHSGSLENWTERNEAAFHGLFGGGGGRYPNRAKDGFALRAPAIRSDSGVPFAAFIHPSNPTSGAYGGFSFVLFPVPEHPCLIALVVGTGGLAPDHGILGRPGHGRKAQAICAWLSEEFGRGQRTAWAKHDPTRTDISVPTDVTSMFAEYKGVFDRYGKEMYAVFRPTGEKAATAAALASFLDLTVEERGFSLLAGAKKESDLTRCAWYEHLMPGVDHRDVVALLAGRKFAILQGPPGTGKTRMALEILATSYGGFGESIQFHPNTTYENFIGGLAPRMGGGEFGLQFAPVPGFLMRAAARAMESPTRPYLLHIDEINRADLGKILGEAVFLLESGADRKREINLAYDFGLPFGSTFSLPPNLHILGTMNSADRSIAIVDIAVRRRFAFVSLWPSMAVVQQHGCPLMVKAFQTLTSHFIEHATDDAFALVPGHSYFLEKDDAQARRSLKVNLAPLLEEYLAQGYVSGFAEPIRSYLQWLRAL